MVFDQRMARDGGAVLSLVTGVAALVQLIASGWSSMPSVLYWAGWVYIAGMPFLVVLAAVKREPLGWWISSVYLVVAGALTWAALSFEWFPAALGLFGVVTFSYAAVVEYVKWHRFVRPAREKTCPMCAEKVKAAAMKCRFCGHSFSNEGEPGVA